MELERQLKYIDFTDIYSVLDEMNNASTGTVSPAQEEQGTTRLTERLLEQGKQQGLHQGKHQGMQQGEVTVLSRLLVRRFGTLTPEIEQRLQQADTKELERWAENILDAETLDDIFSLH